MKKVLYGTALLLVFCILISAVGCAQAADSDKNAATADSGAVNGDVSNETETEIAVSQTLPGDLNFDGASFNMISGDDYNGACFVAELNGERLNDATYEAEIAVETLLNVSITETLSSFWDLQSTISKLINSGDTAYHTSTHLDRFQISLTTSENYIPLDDLSYVDLNANYWGGQGTRSFNIGERTYFAISSFNFRSMIRTSCIFMNMGYAEQLGIGALYDDVRNGTWTYDKLKTTAADGYSDLNGDSTKSIEDNYGYLTYDPRSTTIAAAIACGCENDIYNKDDNNLCVFNVSERFFNVFGMLYDMYHSSEYIYMQKYNAEYTAVYNIFESGRALLAEGILDTASRLRDTAFDYAILPMPKYDESQTAYHSRTSEPNFTMVMKTNKDLELTGAVLEALSVETYNNVVPVYIENTLKVKYARDEDTPEMVQLIIDTREMNIAEAFDYDNFGDVKMLSMIENNSNSMASYIEGKKSSTEAKIIKLNEFFGK